MLVLVEVGVVGQLVEELVEEPVEELVWIELSVWKAEVLIWKVATRSQRYRHCVRKAVPNACRDRNYQDRRN